MADLREHTGVADAGILRAFAHVPRHLFVPEEEVAVAYCDSALPIGFRQTISQPSMIALMLSALDVAVGNRVLEVGGGSGYAAALLAELGAEVYSLEIVPELADSAAERLRELGYDRVHVVAGNGRLGYPRRAPYQRILVSAGADEVPPALVDELAAGGRIVIPVGDDKLQHLLVGTKLPDQTVEWQRSVPCIFVPLVGRA